MRAIASMNFRYSAKRKRAVSTFDHHGSDFTFSDITGYAVSVTSGSWCSSSAIARGMCQFEVTTINELKLCSRAQRLVSSAFPKVFRADRSRSMQQLKYLEYRGVIRAISFELFARWTPVISRRLPRSVASNSMASGMRAAAPVSATMPSALVSSDTSSLAIWDTNQMKPPASRISPVAPAAMVRKPIQRARPANMSVDHFKGVVDGTPGGQGGHEGNQCDLTQHSCIAPEANRERAEKN